MPSFSIPSQASFQLLGCLLVVSSLEYGRHMVQKATIGIVLRSMKGRVSLLTSIGSSVLWPLVLVLVSSEASGDVFKMMAMKLFSRL